MLAFLGMSGDKEYLLLGDYSCTQDEFPVNCSSSDDESASQHNCSDVEADESSSSTDVDVVVQEYKERIQVHMHVVISFELYSYRFR